MATTPSGTLVTLTVHVPDDLSANDLLMHVKFAEAMGFRLVEFGWPQSKAEPLAAA